MADVIELIERDHRVIERLFQRLRDGGGDRAALFQELALLLTAHSRAEEAEVYPEVAEAGHTDQAERSRHEHADADDLVAQLQTMDIETVEFSEVLARLADAVAHHVAQEEETVLPALRDSLDEQQLLDLGTVFTARRELELRQGPASEQVIDPHTSPGSQATKAELDREAAERGLHGHAQMTKQELQEALDRSPRH